MENIGKEPGTAYGNIHGPGYSGCCGIVGSTTLPDGQKLASDFHNFAIEWDANSITWLLDGKPFHRATKSDIPVGSRWVFDHNFSLLLNVAVGGQWPGSPDGTTQFPQSMSVDYVRVFESALPGPAAKPAGSRIEAEDYDSQSGVKAQPTTDVGGGRNIAWAASGDWAAYQRVDFGPGGFSKVDVRGANCSAVNGDVQVRLGVPSGDLIVAVAACPTDGWQVWRAYTPTPSLPCCPREAKKRRALGSQRVDRTDDRNRADCRLCCLAVECSWIRNKQRSRCRSSGSDGGNAS